MCGHQPPMLVRTTTTHIRSLSIPLRWYCLFVSVCLPVRAIFHPRPILTLFPPPPLFSLIPFLAPCFVMDIHTPHQKREKIQRTSLLSRLNRRGKRIEEEGKLGEGRVGLWLSITYEETKEKEDQQEEEEHEREGWGKERRQYSPAEGKYHLSCRERVGKGRRRKKNQKDFSPQVKRDVSGRKTMKDRQKMAKLNFAPSDEEEKKFRSSYLIPRRRRRILHPTS